MKKLLTLVAILTVAGNVSAQTFREKVQGQATTNKKQPANLDAYVVEETEIVGASGAVPAGSPVTVEKETLARCQAEHKAALKQIEALKKQK